MPCSTTPLRLYADYIAVCGADIISFGSGSNSTERANPIAAPAKYSFIRYLDLINRIKLVTIFKNLFSDHDFFNKIVQVGYVINIKELEQEPQLVISAPAPTPEGNVISAPLFSVQAPQHWLESMN
jgi:hypothetical protein